jgi:hypothetical protein
MRIVLTSKKPGCGGLLSRPDPVDYLGGLRHVCPYGQTCPGSRSREPQQSIIVECRYRFLFVYIQKRFSAFLSFDVVTYHGAGFLSLFSINRISRLSTGDSWAIASTVKPVLVNDISKY